MGDNFYAYIGICCDEVMLYVNVGCNRIHCLQYLNINVENHIFSRRDSGVILLLRKL